MLKPLLERWFDKQSATKLVYVASGLFVMSLLTLGVALAIQHTERTAQTSQANRGFPIGTQLSLGEVTVKAESVVFDGGNGVFSAPSNKRYAIISLAITNRSDAPINVFPAADTYMRDQQGNTIYLSPFTLDEPFHAGELAAGETIRGQLSYLAPSSGPLKFYVDSIWSGGIIKYAIR